jgi:hypothetical protein
MARAYGWNSRLLLGFESLYGQAPASGDYYQIPFISSSLDSEQGLIESSVLGQGRDPSAPFQDVINVDGDLVVPMDLRYIGLWLTALFGAPSTTGAGPFSHEFHSGQISLPSLTLEMGLPEVPEYLRFSGVRANTLALNFQRSGEAQATVGLMGQSETVATTTIDATPAELIYSRFSQFQGSVTRGGQPLADVTSASLTYSNNLERIETIRDDGKVEAIDPGMSALTGSISVRYGNSELMDLARSGTPIDLELAYTIDAEKQIRITAHEVYLPKPKRSISGPGGIEASYDFQGAREQTLGHMFTITLINDLEGWA